MEIEPAEIIEEKTIVETAIETAIETAVLEVVEAIEEEELKETVETLEEKIEVLEIINDIQTNTDADQWQAIQNLSIQVATLTALTESQTLAIMELLTKAEPGPELIVIPEPEPMTQAEQLPNEEGAAPLELSKAEAETTAEPEKQTAKRRWL
jgi:hypothetical protein